MNISVFIFVGLAFAPLGGTMAGIITYEEYSHHVDSKRARKMALESGLFVTGVLFLVAVIGGYLFSLILSK